MRTALSRPAIVAVAVGTLCGLMQIWASWPGWLAGDSVAMLLEARRAAPVTDWHSPLLIAAWRVLGDMGMGPVIPMVMQVTTTWVGLTLISQRLIRLGWRLGWIMLPAAFLLGTVWTPSWVLKDSFSCALMVLALGVASLSDVARGSLLRTTTWLAPTLLIAAATVPRWFMAPIFAVAALAAVWLADRQGLKSVLSVLGVFGVTVLFLFGLERFWVDPQPLYGSGSTMFLDLARVECVLGSPEQRAAGQSLFPQQLVRAGDPGRDICEDFSPLTHDTLFRFSDTAPTDSPYYVLPRDSAQMSQLTDAWLAVWRDHPGILIGDRVILAANLISADSQAWWSPSIDLMTNPSVTLPAGVGEGEVTGNASRGGLLLTVLATATLLGSALLTALPFGLMTIVVLPVSAGWRLHRRNRPRLRQFWPSLLFPVLYLAAFSFVAPSNDYRYVNLAAVWGLLVSAWAWAESMAARHAEAEETERGRRIHVDVRD